METDAPKPDYAPAAPAAPPEPERSHAATWIRVAVGVVAVLAVGALTFAVSQAAFSGQTSTKQGTASTGTVTLTNDASGTTLFDVVGLNGGQTFSSCVAVRYDGSIVPAPVVLHGASSGSLGDYLDMTIEIGTGKTYTPGDTGCSTFTGGQNIYTGTLTGFVNAHSGFSNALPTTWSAASTGQVKAFKFTMTVKNDNAAQGKSAQPTFTWETSPPAT